MKSILFLLCSISMAQAMLIEESDEQQPSLETAISSLFQADPPSWAIVLGDLGKNPLATLKPLVEEHCSMQSCYSETFEDDPYGFVFEEKRNLRMKAGNPERHVFVGPNKVDDVRKFTQPLCSLYHCETKNWASLYGYRYQEADYRTKKYGCTLMIMCFNKETVAEFHQNTNFARKIQEQINNTQTHPDVSHLFILDKQFEQNVDISHIDPQNLMVFLNGLSQLMSWQKDLCVTPID